MIAACQRARVKLMIAYRLHFEALNLEAMDLARTGKLGELKFFNSSFSMSVRRGDIRTKRAYGGGTLYDIGVYCINAARNLFRSEPTQVSAVSINSGLASLAEIDETTAATLRFGDEQVATFITSFNASDVAAYRIVGTKGDLHADPAYEYAEGSEYSLTIDGKTKRKAFSKHDQFAPELLYFSDCILANREPEPSGEEGLQDVRIVQALYKSAATGRPVALRPFTKRTRPTGRQRITRPGVRSRRWSRSRAPARTDGPISARRFMGVQVDLIERHVPMRHQELESPLFLPLELGAVGYSFATISSSVGDTAAPPVRPARQRRPVGPSVAMILRHEVLTDR